MRPGRCLLLLPLPFFTQTSTPSPHPHPHPPLAHLIKRDKAADAINLKISKVGGLTKARQIRDLCVSLGIAMNIEDTWGGDIVTAAISHLAHSTPEKFLLASTDFNSYVTVRLVPFAVFVCFATQ